MTNVFRVCGPWLIRLAAGLARPGPLLRGGATTERNAADGRGFDVTLTEDGLAALEGAYPVHLRSVRARVLDHVDPGALPGFAKVVTAIAEALEQCGSIELAADLAA